MFLHFFKIERLLEHSMFRQLSARIFLTIQTPEAQNVENNGGKSSV